MKVIRLIDALQNLATSSSAAASDGGSTGHSDSSDIPPGSRWVTTHKDHRRILISASGQVISKGKASEAIRAKVAQEGNRPQRVSPEVSGTGEENDNPNSTKWERIRGCLHGLMETDAYALATSMAGMTDPRMFHRLTRAQQEIRARQTIQTLTSYIALFGDPTTMGKYVVMAQRNLASQCPQMMQEFPRFFTPAFLREETGIRERKAFEVRNARRKTQELSEASFGLQSASEAKDLVSRIDEAMQTLGETQALRDAKARAMKVAHGQLPNEEAGSEAKTEKVEFSDPIFPASLDELHEDPDTPRQFGLGFTFPQLMIDKNGKRWVLKEGGAPGHAQVEYECSQAYRALGIRAPASRMYGTKRLAEYIEGENLGEAMSKATPEQKALWMKELRDGFAADVVLGNHDLIGDDEDNILIGRDGHVWRIDNGGALGRKGSGPEDEKFKDGWIDDLWTMRGKSPSISDSAGQPYSNPQLEKYFGDMTTHEVLQRADSLPWEKALPFLEQSSYREPTPGGRMFKGQRTRLSLGRQDILKQRIGEIHRLAATSRSVVNDGRYSNEYNEDLLKMTYALAKTNFRELAGFRQKGGSPAYYDAISAGWARSKFDGQLPSLHRGGNLLADYANVNGESMSTILRNVAANSGINLAASDRLLAAQGRDAVLEPEAAHLKVLELEGLGYPLGRIAQGNIPDIAPHVKARVMAAARFYQSNEKAHDEERKATLLRKAATMLFFQLAGVPNFDPKTNRLLVLRTESPAVLGSAVVNGGKGKVMDAYPRDSHASCSWYQTCTPHNDNHLVAMSLPMSRISACDLFTDSNGKNLFNQWHRRETEVGANAIGLPFVYLGTTASETPISDYFEKVADAERRSGRTLDGRAFRSVSEYDRICAPWARDIRDR